MRIARWAALIACASSCVSAAPGEEEPPALVVTAPARAARLDTKAVRVEGRASDPSSGIASVTVNGRDAEVAASGAFTVELPLAPGVSLVEVVATDRAGNQARDVRAVLAGARPAGGVISSGLVARVAARGYPIVAEGVRSALDEVDLGAAVGAPGALMGVPGCYQVYLDRLAHGAVEVELEPREDGVGVTVDVRDLVLDLRVETGGLCGGGSAPARLSADTLRLRGVARFALADGRVAPAIDELAAEPDGVELDTGQVPSAVVELLASAAPAELAGAVGGAIGGLAAGVIEEALGDLDAIEWTTAIEGLGMTVRLAPAAVEADLAGLAVSSWVELRFADLGPVEYAPGPAAGPPALDGDGALRVALADDVANLILAALWTAGLLDRSVVVPEDHPARTRLGLDRLDLTLLLPPFVATGEDRARVVIGDALVTAHDLDGAIVMRLATSAAADLALGDRGPRVALVPDHAQIWISSLGDDGATVALPEPLRLAAVDEVSLFLDHALASLPLPALGEVARVSGLGAVPGYVVLEADPAAP